MGDAHAFAQTSCRPHEVEHSGDPSVCAYQKLNLGMDANTRSAYWRRGHATRFMSWCTRLADLEGVQVVRMA
jgi:hypothetical protein